MSVDRLQATLDAIDVSVAPDAWALAAYRLAVARAESANRRDDLEREIVLLERAGRILTARRAPIEHARVLVAIGSCLRLQGSPADAADCFRRAIDIQRGRSAGRELAATTVDLGLALAESGRPDEAVEVLDRVLSSDELHGDAVAHDDERRRLRGSALVNRAQARQAQGSTGFRPAVDDYRAAIRCFAPDEPQRGLAHHGLGTVLLALGGEPSEAIEQFETSLTILTASSFPLQHAVARHSLAIAFERRGGRHDAARGLGHAEAAVTVFDPRLHATPWRMAADTVARLCGSLGVGSEPEGRAAVFVELCDEVDEDERARLLRDRLTRIAACPAPARSRDLLAVVAAAAVEPGRFERLVRAAIPVLMELPDDNLADACSAIVAAIEASPEAAVLDRSLDDVVHDLLFGPQRVRVRDLLAASGWERP